MGMRDLESKKILLFLVVLVAVAIAVGSQNFFTSTGDMSSEITGQLFTPAGILSDISVNGETITQEEIDSAYENLPDEVKQGVTKENITESLVAQTLLLQEAESKGIVTTEEEVDLYIEQLQALGFDDNELQKFLADQGYTLDEYRESIKDLITVSKLLDQELDLQNVQATEGDVNSYIQENQGEVQELFDEGGSEFENIFRERVKQQLTQEKQQEIVNNYIESLKQNAQIEY